MLSDPYQLWAWPWDRCINHCANDLVILNKVVLHIVSETVKAVC